MPVYRRAIILAPRYKNNRRGILAPFGSAQLFLHLGIRIIGGVYRHHLGVAYLYNRAYSLCHFVDEKNILYIAYIITDAENATKMLPKKILHPERRVRGFLGSPS